jgi:hypothetical protein
MRVIAKKRCRVMVEPPEKGFYTVAVICSSCLPRSPSGKQGDGEHGKAENDGGDPDRFDVEGPSWVKCHAPSLAVVEGQR